MINRLLSLLIKIFVLLIARTVRLKVYNREQIDELKRAGKSLIFVFWHQEIFLLVDYYRHYNHNPVTILASPSRDGDIAEAVLRRFQFGVVRGSSRRNGFGGLIGVIKAIKGGNDVALTIDGPTGPPGVAKPGALYIAQRTNSLLIPVGCWAKPNFKLSLSWDKMMIPMPFSRGVIVFGTPLQISKGSEQSIQKSYEELQKNIEETSAKAKELCA